MGAAGADWLVRPERIQEEEPDRMLAALEIKEGAVVADVVTGPGTAPAWLAAHRWLTLAVLVPLAGHVFLAALHPATRHALHGMLSGRVDGEWAAAHHPRWRRDEEEAATG